MRPIVGTKIELRQYNITDAVEIHRWRHDHSTTVWMGRKFRHLPTLEEVTESLGRVISSVNGESLFFAIANPHSHEYVGGIDLTSIDQIDKNGVLSVVISKESDRGKGLASEAIRLLLEHAFSCMSLHKVILNVDSRNLAAVNCYKKIGFIEEGRHRDHSFVNGEFSDVIIMSILKAEFIGSTT